MKTKDVFGAVHKPTGKTAMLQVLFDGLCIAQFDDPLHRHAHGWHPYFRKDFRTKRWFPKRKCK